MAESDAGGPGDGAIDGCLEVQLEGQRWGYFDPWMVVGVLDGTGAHLRTDPRCQLTVMRDGARWEVPAIGRARDVYARVMEARRRAADGLAIALLAENQRAGLEERIVAAVSKRVSGPALREEIDRVIPNAVAACLQEIANGGGSVGNPKPPAPKAPKASVGAK